MYLISALRHRHTKPIITLQNTAQDDATGTLAKRRRPAISPDCILNDESRKSYATQLRSRKQAPATFPTPIEYNDFLVALSPTLPEARPLCEHPRHPADEPDYHQKHCAVCTYEIYLNFFTLVSKKWNDIGGPWHIAPKRHEPSRKLYYNNLKKAWHYARMLLANLLRLLESKAALERLWERRNSRKAAKGTMSACTAIDLARNMSCDIFQSPDKTATMTSVVVRKSIKRVPKTVTFTADTSYDAAPRSQANFHRGSSFYAAGKYACPSRIGWLDTSAQNCWKVSIAQCKLFITEDRQDMAGEPPGKAMQRGILGTYAYSDEVIKYLNDHARTSSLGEQVQLLRLYTACDAILLFKPRIEREVHDGKKRKKIAVIEDVRPFFHNIDDTCATRIPISEEAVEVVEKSAHSNQFESDNLVHTTPSLSDISDEYDLNRVEALDWMYTGDHVGYDLPLALRESLDAELDAPRT